MNNPTKTPVELVQDLIAIHVTRKEASERLTGGAKTGIGLEAAGSQSQRFIDEWMQELSAFGDGVAATADRETPYYAIWKKALPGVDDLDPAAAGALFNQMEQALKEKYQQEISEQGDLPESINTLLQKQAEAINGKPQ